MLAFHHNLNFPNLVFELDYALIIYIILNVFQEISVLICQNLLIFKIIHLSEFNCCHRNVGSFHFSKSTWTIQKRVILAVKKKVPDWMATVDENVVRTSIVNNFRTWKIFWVALHNRSHILSPKQSCTFRWFATYEHRNLMFCRFQ